MCTYALSIRYSIHTFYLFSRDKQSVRGRKRAKIVGSFSSFVKRRVIDETLSVELDVSSVVSVSCRRGPDTGVCMQIGYKGNDIGRFRYRFLCVISVLRVRCSSCVLENLSSPSEFRSTRSNTQSIVTVENI